MKVQTAKTLSIVGLFIGSVVLAVTQYGSLKRAWLGNDQADQIVAEAKLKVPELVLPPKPETVQVTDGFDEQYQEIRIPAPAWGDFGRTVTQRVLVSRTPRTRVVEPPTAQVEAWEKEVSRLNGQYHVALRREISALEAESSKAFRDAVGEWVKTAGGAATAIASIVGLAIAIRKERRESGAPSRRRRSSE